MCSIGLENVRPPCATCAANCGTAKGSLCPNEGAASGTQKKFRAFDRHSIIYESGRVVKEIYALYSGWAYGFMLLPDGRRQILSFYTPGDLILVEGRYGGQLWFSVQSLTDVALCVLDLDQVQSRIEADENVAQRMRMLRTETYADKDRRILDLGRRRAIERVAVLIQDIHTRFLRLERVEVDGFFPFPLRQEHIADAMGLTRVHVSRVLGELRDDGTIEMIEGKMRILDRERLRRLYGAPLRHSLIGGNRPAG